MSRLRVLGFALAATVFAASAADAAKLQVLNGLRTGGATTIKGTPNPVAHTYTFTVRSFKITDTRSLHEDTDTVFTAAAIGGGPTAAPPGKPMGDLNNGSYTVNLTVPASLGDAQVVDFTYNIVNGGYSNSYAGGMEKLAAIGAAKGVILAGDAVGQELAGNLGGVIGAYVGASAPAWAIDKVLGFIFPNCDGVVAAADHIYTGAQLAAQTANGRVIQGTDNNPGTDSPHGCGSNSHYFVSWAISG